MTEVDCVKATKLSKCKECSGGMGCVRVEGYQEACTKVRPRSSIDRKSVV